MPDLLVIHVDGRVSTHEWKDNALSQLQSIVGGYIERIPFSINNRFYEAYVNEDGKVGGLSVNETATLLFNLSVEQAEGGVQMVQSTLFFDPVVGPLVICLTPFPK